MEGFSPKLPLARDQFDGLYANNKTAVESIKQDLKMLILTNPGERVMLPSYGVGIRKMLFEQNSQNARTSIVDSIRNQVNRYMNFLSIEDVIVETDPANENSINISLIYRIPYTNSIQEMNISLDR